MIFYFLSYKKKNDFFIKGWGCFVLKSMIFRVLLKFDYSIVIMDHACIERVILIWVLLSATLGNFLFCKSQAEIYYFKKFHLQCLAFNQFCVLC